MMRMSRSIRFTFPLAIAISVMPMSTLVFAEEVVPNASVSESASSVPAPSQHSRVISELKQKVTEGLYKQAYQQGMDNQESMEGIPGFDFYFGMAAIEAGHPQQALFAFERLVAENPEVPRYRLEYARALFFTNSDEAAKREFETVLSQIPPKAVEENVNRFLAAIESRKSNREGGFSGMVYLGGGYDSNINNATDAESVGIFQLPESSRETASGFSSLGITGLYLAPVDQRTQLATRVGTRHKYNYVMSDYSLDTLSVDVMGVHQWTRVAFKLGYSYSHTLLNTDDYQRVQQINTDVRMAFRSNFAVSMGFSAANTASFSSDLLDAYQLMGNLAVDYSASYGDHSLGFIAGSENPREQGATYNGKDFYGVSYRFGLDKALIDNKLSPYVFLSWFSAKYKADHPFFGTRRDDDALQILVGANYQLAQNWQVVAEVSTVSNSSSLDIYDYSRNLFETRIQYVF